MLLLMSYISGKSSLLSSLFRILIDNIPHSLLRSRIVALPQQPYLLPGPIRRNMDPENQSSDHAIKNALEKVGLWDIVTSTRTASPAPTEIDSPLDKILNTETLSPGQRQLFVLSRSLLLTPRPKVLISDEASSNLDMANDALMQRIVREESADQECTVIAIAHRLESIMDFDTVAVLERGKVVEIGNLSALVHQGGAFARMVG